MPAMLTAAPAPGSYPNRRLYANGASLWDVTSGSNGSCGTYLCQAEVGYDGPTGLGTPDGTAALAPDVLDLGAGTRTSCALTDGGTISRWGCDGDGEADAPAGTYVALSTGDSHSCAIDSGRALHCWGDDTFGQSSPPAGSYLTVSAGGGDSCAIGSNRSLHRWGDASHGVTTPPAGTYSAVSVGAYHSCAYLAASTECWGGNADGESTPLFATTSLPVAGTGYAYATDVTLSTAVVPAPTFSVTAGSLPAGFTLSTSGQLSGTSSTPGSYLFTVTASNGIAPAASQSLTLEIDYHPAPGAPTSVVAVASNTTAVVSWAAPVPNSDAPVTGYTVTSSPATTSCVLTLAMTCSFDGLTNHTNYTFSVTATSDYGTGPATSASATPVLGATYIPVTPNRLVDSRAGTRLGLKSSLKAGTPAEFVVINRSTDPNLNIPGDATAVTGNLTVTNQTSNGYLVLTPDHPSGTPTTSTLNFPRGDNRANAVTVPLSPTGTLWVTFIGTAGARTDVVFDVTGYFAP
jgi:hypothetical protein